MKNLKQRLWFFFHRTLVLTIAWYLLGLVGCQLIIEENVEDLHTLNPFLYQIADYFAENKLWNMVAIFVFVVSFTWFAPLIRGIDGIDFFDDELRLKDYATGKYRIAFFGMAAMITEVFSVFAILFIGLPLAALFIPFSFIFWSIFGFCAVTYLSLGNMLAARVDLWRAKKKKGENNV